MTVEQAVGAKGTPQVRGISVQLVKQANGLCRYDPVTLSYSVN